MDKEGKRGCSQVGILGCPAYWQCELCGWNPEVRKERGAALERELTGIPKLYLGKRVMLRGIWVQAQQRPQNTPEAEPEKATPAKKPKTKGKERK